jgi:SAM-dependent methyltransferase
MDGGQAYDALDELYDAWCAEVQEDIPFYLGLAASLAGELDVERLDIVELGAGSGRITLPLALAGHRVRAIDASQRQLERLSAASADADVAAHIEILHADMRDLAQLVPAGSAHLVLAPFRSMLHVTRERDRVFEQVHDVLTAEGAFAFDVFHARPDQVATLDGQWLHRRTETTTTGKWRFDERATYRPAPAGDPADESLLDVDVRCEWKPRARVRRRIDPSLAADPAADATTATTTLHLRLAPAAAWRASLERTGFEIDGAYGWFDARPLGPDDDDSIWIARRAE